MTNKVADTLETEIIQLRRSVSDAIAQAIDKEVRDLADDAHETALNILRIICHYLNLFLKNS